MTITVQAIDSRVRRRDWIRLRNGGRTGRYCCESEIPNETNCYPRPAMTAGFR